jgi:hypothetical protein
MYVGTFEVQLLYTVHSALEFGGVNAVTLHLPGGVFAFVNVCVCVCVCVCVRVCVCVCVFV